MSKTRLVLILILRPVPPSGNRQPIPCWLSAINDSLAPNPTITLTLTLTLTLNGNSAANHSSLLATRDLMLIQQNKFY